MAWATIVVLSLCISKMGPALWGYGKYRRIQRSVTDEGNRLGGQGSEEQETRKGAAMMASPGWR